MPLQQPSYVALGNKFREKIASLCGGGVGTAVSETHPEPAHGKGLENAGNAQSSGFLDQGLSNRILSLEPKRKPFNTILSEGLPQKSGSRKGQTGGRPQGQVARGRAGRSQTGRTGLLPASPSRPHEVPGHPGPSNTFRLHSTHTHSHTETPFPTKHPGCSHSLPQGKGLSSLRGRQGGSRLDILGGWGRQGQTLSGRLMSLPVDNEEVRLLARGLEVSQEPLLSVLPHPWASQSCRYRQGRPVLKAHPRGTHIQGAVAVKFPG